MNDLAPTQPDVVLEHSTALPLVAMSIALRRGAELEPEGKEGLARILGRLMRRTGANLTADLTEQRIDSLGGSLGADVSQNLIGFSGIVIERSLEPFFDLVADVICKPGFPEDELERLKRETEGEIVENRDNDQALVQRWFRRKLFQGHAYGRPVGGTLSSVRSITMQDVRALYEELFRSDGLVFGFAGDIQPERAQEFASRIRQGLRQEPAAPSSQADPEPIAGRRLVIVNKPERTQAQILIGGLGTHPQDTDHIPMVVANTIFGGTFTARMTREIRSKRGWSYGAYSNLPYSRYREAFSMWTFPNASDASACIELQLEMLQEWVEKGVTKRELAWAKRYLTRSHAFTVDTASKRVGLALDELLYELPTGYYTDFLERVRAVSIEEVDTALKRRISLDDLLICVVGTEQDIGQPITDAIPNLSNVEVVGYDSDR